MTEPLATAVLLTVAGVLMALSVAFSRVSGRLGLPAALLFLVVGMLAGSEGIGRIPFEDYGFAFRLGTVALALILFDGGLNTPLASIRQAWQPALALATFGVAGTAALVAVAARLLGFDWAEAFLLGAVVSSTDAAAVFSVLRGTGVHLKRRVGVTLELESGLNDPLAVILTVGLTTALVSEAPLGWSLLGAVVAQLAVGGALGYAIGQAGRMLLRRVTLPVAGLYPVMTLALAFLAFGVPTMFGGSGFLAVYVAGVVLGNSTVPYRTGLLRVHDAVAWFAQVAMFLVLGLLVFPSRLPGVAAEGFAIALFLGMVARPLMVVACLLPFRYPPAEILYVGWVGLRGAVPVILATFPVLAGAPGASRIFHLVFFVVVLNALLQGGTVRWLTRRLGLVSDEPPDSSAVLEISSTQLLSGEVLSFYIDAASVVSHTAIADIPFPAGAAVMLIVRQKELIAARGGTTLRPGDHVYVFCRPEDVPFVRLMFGRPESA